MRLVALVVAESARGQKLGQQLVNVIREWAEKNGAVHISLTSGFRRTEAHKFYEHLGFTASGTRFGLDLN